LAPLPTLGHGVDGLDDEVEHRRGQEHEGDEGVQELSVKLRLSKFSLPGIETSGVSR
jgi:hypothetical protein